MEPGDSPDGEATPEDVRQAIGALSKEDLYRLFKYARYCLPGTGYVDPMELIGEAVARTMAGAYGGKERHWPKVRVPFYTYLKNTIRSLVSEARESEEQSKTLQLEAITPTGTSTEEFLGHLQHCHPDALTLELARERQDEAIVDLAKIEASFSGDDEVLWIIEGMKDGLAATEIREMTRMTQIEYETARRRFRRGLDKLFPEKRIK